MTSSCKINFSNPTCLLLIACESSPSKQELYCFRIQPTWSWYSDSIWLNWGICWGIKDAGRVNWPLVLCLYIWIHLYSSNKKITQWKLVYHVIWLHIRRFDLFIDIIIVWYIQTLKCGSWTRTRSRHCHPMMTSSNGNIFGVTALCAGNSPVTGEFPSQRAVTRNFDGFFDLR